MRFFLISQSGLDPPEIKTLVRVNKILIGHKMAEERQPTSQLRRSNIIDDFGKIKVTTSEVTHPVSITISREPG